MIEQRGGRPPGETSQSPERKPLLDGKTALVTGDRTGIGRGIVLALVREGVKDIYGVSRNPADELVQEVDMMGATLHHIQADLSTEEGVSSVIRRIDDDGVRLTTMVLSAGTTYDKRIEEAQWTDVNEAYNTNVIGAHMMVSQALEGSLLRRGSSIILITSVVGKYGNYHQEEYGETKAAQGGLIRTLSKSAGRLGIRVNGVAPGMVKTDLTRELLEADDGKAEKAIRDVTPLGKLASIDDVGNMVVFLASDYASAVTGQEIDVDGGAGAAIAAVFPILAKGWDKLDSEERAAVEAIRARKKAERAAAQNRQQIN